MVAEKTNAHNVSVRSVGYDKDGGKIVSGGGDGKIKVWDIESGFCIVTFTEHTSGVTACEFAKRAHGGKLDEFRKLRVYTKNVVVLLPRRLPVGDQEALDLQK